MGSVGFVGSGGFWWVLMGSMRSGVFFVILNVVKNLSERGGGRAIVDGSAIPEILRLAQDDNRNRFSEF